MIVPLMAATMAAHAKGQQAFAGGGCAGELLYNSICIPHRWPPLWDGPGSGPAGLPPRSGTNRPPYIRSPPAVIDVSLGRQLFVDPFLIESMPGLQLLSHPAKWHLGQLMRATQPWEAWVPSIPKQDYPQGPLATGFAYPFSGGLWREQPMGATATAANFGADQ